MANGISLLLDDNVRIGIKKFLLCFSEDDKHTALLHSRNVMSTLAVDGRKVFSHHHTFSFSLMILLLLGPYTTILFFINAELKSWPGGVSGAPIAFFHIVERLVV